MLRGKYEARITIHLPHVDPVVGKGLAVVDVDEVDGDLEGDAGLALGHILADDLAAGRKMSTRMHE